ncbi:MAG: branched-chain amino acid ABC transporter permease [Alphaproteobacteria bacterium]|jgi:branched-chain amino acid transport system permease protein|uniref:branched-chain amino acid ABC transporter permease n=1 Tax=Pacificispira sp. TaxID=2888761 RepID=UPI001AFD3491|nr:branched-chain amino acid ABC transporter permease [Alphaproteobacteria bacterium]MBO6864231.1 branched-chain amino acid ABC transporter permease [Alphaproteobacteria bacterium]MEC9268191.1 branched-chain amino acid ABC transporter permease [Pseudomonadota bacterium]
MNASDILTPKGLIAAAVILLLAVMPVLTAIADQAFYLDIATRILILAIAAVSLNLILGYGGMVSFGHAAFIGIGAYAVGIPIYYDEYSGWLHFPLAIAVSALYALITGAISLRTKGVHFIMITMAFSQMVFFLFISLEEYGGDDGLLIWSDSEFVDGVDVDDPTTFYYLCFISLMGALFLVHRIVNSRFGRVIRGSMSNDKRMKALGYPTYGYKLTAYVISGAICGYAGALMGNFTNFISPEMMGWTRSGELIFMVVLGGSGSVMGPIYGVLSFLLLEEFLPDFMDLFSKDAGIYWHLPFGIILVLVVLFVRGGINGLLDRWNR